MITGPSLSRRLFLLQETILSPTRMLFCTAGGVWWGGCRICLAVTMGYGVSLVGAVWVGILVYSQAEFLGFGF